MTLRSPERPHSLYVCLRVPLQTAWLPPSTLPFLSTLTYVVSILLDRWWVLMWGHRRFHLVSHYPSHSIRAFLFLSKVIILFKILQVLKLKNQSSSSEFNSVNSPLPESLNPEGNILYLRTKLSFSPEEASGLFHSYPLSHLLGAQDVYHKGKSFLSPLT